MSSTPARRTRKILIGALAAVALFGGVALATAPTGAWFSDSKPVTAMAQSGNASITVSDTSHASTCVMNFGTVNPGHTGVATCTVTNTGTTPLKISLSAIGTTSVVAPHATPVNTIDGAKYFVAIDSFLAATALNAFGTPVALGSLNPGDSYTYTVRFTVDETVGNEGQDAMLGVGATITGTQY